PCSSSAAGQRAVDASASTPGHEEDTMPISTGVAELPSLSHAAKLSAHASARAEVPTVPAHVMPRRSPAELVALASQGLIEAAQAKQDGRHYATAHLAALRPAAAVLAAWARREPRLRNRTTSVWA